MKRRTLPRPALALLALGAVHCDGCEDPGVAMLTPVLEHEPQILDLGEVPVGVRVQGAVTVRSRGDLMLTLESVTLEDEGLFRLMQAPPRVLPPNASDALQIEARPTEIGTFTTRLSIRSDDPLRPEVSIPVRVRALPAPPCDDGNACTTDWFDTETGECKNEFADGTPCEPADRCIIDAVCAQGVCLGRRKTCDDGSVCTRDICRQTDGECVFILDERSCDDDNPCTADFCGDNGCEHVELPNGTACDDGDLCTRGDACFAGRCVGTGRPNGTACDDGNSCTVNDTCFDGVCSGQSIVEAAPEGQVIFRYGLTPWQHRAFLHRREVSLSDGGVFFGMDHLNLPNDAGLTHVAFAMEQCGTETYQFAYRPPDAHVLVSYVRRAMQVAEDGGLRMVVGVRQRPQDGFQPQTTTYLLDEQGQVMLSGIQTLGGETGRSLLPDGSHIFGVIWPLTQGPATPERPTAQNLVVVREDVAGRVLWRHERASGDWSEFLGVAGPRVLFWSQGRFGALDFNTGATVWTQQTPFVAKEMALSTTLNLGVIRTNYQLIGVEILNGRQVFAFPEVEDYTYLPRTDPVIAADGRILVLMERRAPDYSRAEKLDWVELDAEGRVLETTPLPYVFPEDWGQTRHEDWDDPYPTVADDGVAYVGYGDSFFALDPGGRVRWTLTSTTPNAYTGTVPLLREDGVLLISERSRAIIGVRTNGGRMSDDGWASFRHDGRRTNHTP